MCNTRVNLCRAFLQIVVVLLISIIHKPGAHRSSGVACAGTSWRLCSSPEFKEIEPGLYLGNTKAACDPSLIENLKITHILTIDSKPISKRVLFNQFNMTNLYIQALDSPEEQIISYVPTTNAFIAEGLKGGRILVHSCNGRSRAAALIVAFFMDKRGFSYDQALELVKSRRPSVKLNSGFEEQLREYRPSEKASQIILESLCDSFLCFGCSYFYYVWGVIVGAVLLSLVT